MKGIIVIGECDNKCFIPREIIGLVKTITNANSSAAFKERFGEQGTLCKVYFKHLCENMPCIIVKSSLELFLKGMYAVDEISRNKENIIVDITSGKVKCMEPIQDDCLTICDPIDYV